MQTVGIMASAMFVVGAFVATAVALKSIPDIRRYRRIRDM